MNIIAVNLFEPVVDRKADTPRARARLRGVILSAFIVAASSCGSHVDEAATGSVNQKVVAYNGLGAYGVEWNGLSFNGTMWNGLGWNGTMWNGTMWNGMGWNGTMWNGTTWNGTMWNGMGYNGTMWNGTMWNGVPGQNAPTFTALHNWVNHQDVNNNNIPTDQKENLCGPENSGTYDPTYNNDVNDLNARLDALSYWYSCACPAGLSNTFSDTHGRGSRTFYGGLGFGPTWCTGDINTPVPQEEIEMVSACLMARVNMQGKHVPISLRSTDGSTALSEGEKFTHQASVAWHWGNLWKEPHDDNDTTTAYSSTNFATSGGFWRNTERFSCTLPGTTLNNKVAFGRDCDVTVCAPDLSYLGPCGPTSWGSSGKKRLDATSPTRLAVAPLPTDPTVAGGLVGINGAAGGGTLLDSVNYRGRSWRALEVYGPSVASLETPLDTAPPSNSTAKLWVQDENSQSYAPTTCTEADPCEGSGSAGQKLTNLTTNQVISVNLHNNGTFDLANPSAEPMTVAIRYSKNGLLGPGQCHPNTGCVNMMSIWCASNALAANGSCFGTGNPLNAGKLKIWVMTNQPNATNDDTTWVPVHGSINTNNKNIFPPTLYSFMYSTAYIYPVYIQNSSSSIGHGRTATTHKDTIRIKLAGDSATTADSPHLDMAYFFPGPPPEEADCKGQHGCWLYAGPNKTFSSLGPGTYWRHTTASLPPGSYTFTLSGITGGNPNLYCKIGGYVSNTGDYTVKSENAGTANESCTVQLTQQSVIGLAVYNAGATATTGTFMGKN